MALAQLDETLCRACGLCVSVCPGRVLTSHPETRRPVFDADFDPHCLGCGQCMAVCGPRAIRVRGLVYDADLVEFEAEPATATAFEALLETRRSVRRFTAEPVARELLEQIVQQVSLAPMGFPPHKVELTVIADREPIASVVPAIQKWYRDFLWIFAWAPVRWLFRQTMSRGEYALLAEHVQPLLTHALARIPPDFDYVTYDAPAMILVHAHRDAPDHVNDAVIALTYTFLAAHAAGLGATVIGLIPPAVERLPQVRERFGLAADQHVVGAVVLGHPAVPYRRGVRREQQVHWVAGATS